jgi:asparagine synthase (glutamine-hydrolysing)
MCGIAALVSVDADPHAEAIVARMVGALRHRGPDSSGVRRFGRGVLGSARLAIVDVDGGSQPMVSANGRAGLAFNGAIYGFKELKAQLPEYPFRTATDTEVILALYERYGAGCVTRLPGMFAFAVWDVHTETLFCARDRFGEKPLYYARGPAGELLIASEIGSLLASGLIEPVLSREAVSHYLARLHVHPAQTIYANVHALPPAHTLRFRRGKLTVERYWEPPAIDHRISMDDAVERFRELFDAAVRKQLVADVPVGVFLSGGIDSSTVTAVASSQKPGVQTFAFGFREGIENEQPYARAMARQCGTTHVEVDDNGDIAGLLWRMQDVYDEPFGDSSNIPTFLICERARRSATVVLGGDGADELLGGYVAWSRYLLNGNLAPGSEVAPPRQRGVWRWFGGGAQADQGSALAHRYGREFRSCFSSAERTSLGFTDDIDRLVDYRRYRTGTTSDMMRFDADLYLPGDILVKTDRASMAHGLELRAPFLDIDVASFCLSLPDMLKVDGQQEKLLLRRAYESTWTPEIRGRAKQGFGGPMPQWLRSAPLRDLKRDYLGDRNQAIFGLLDFESAQLYTDRDTQQTWTLLVLALWLAKHPCSLPS